jgi:hypothetical protein
MAERLPTFVTGLPNLTCLWIFDESHRLTPRTSYATNFLKAHRSEIEDVLYGACPTKHCLVLPHSLVPSADLGQVYDQALQELMTDSSLDERKLAIIVPGLLNKDYQLEYSLHEHLTLSNPSRWFTNLSPRSARSSPAREAPFDFWAFD